jgi:hypothetical protein
MLSKSFGGCLTQSLVYLSLGGYAASSFALENPTNVAPAAGAVVVASSTTTAAATESAAPAMPERDDQSASEKSSKSSSTGKDTYSSVYIPVDSAIYPMALRLYSMGYLNTAVISMRPWTRRSLWHMLQQTQQQVMDSNNDEAIAILARLEDLLGNEATSAASGRRIYGVESGYVRAMGLSGDGLRDSFHLGQTFVNDYGRPYGPGFNSLAGTTAMGEVGRFSLYLRGEYQHAPGITPYSTALANQLSEIDVVGPDAAPNYPQATIPYGNTAAQNNLRLVEGYVSFHVLGHEVSGGKMDSWTGPAMGGGFGWSNNAENIYSFRAERVEPLYIPLLSHWFGTVRYNFFVGSLKGHTDPNSPWIHSEMFAFRPTDNFEFGFQRSVIWGGEGHEPVTLHTFLRSFFSTVNVPGTVKFSRDDPGARFGSFNFSWRLPFVSHHLTLYTDTEAHDDVSPIDAPRHAAYRPGLYLSQVPRIPKLDLRVEAVSTDTATLRSLGGQYNYFEAVQRQGYTNKGFIMGDWIGREAKGGNAWLTYHLSPGEWVQLSYANKKTPKDFIPGGTTQNQFKVDVLKRLRPTLEMNAWAQYERWKAPIWVPGQKTDTSAGVQLTWFPELKQGGLRNERR